MEQAAPDTKPLIACELIFKSEGKGKLLKLHGKGIHRAVEDSAEHCQVVPPSQNQHRQTGDLAFRWNDGMTPAQQLHLKPEKSQK